MIIALARRRVDGNDAKLSKLGWELYSRDRFESGPGALREQKRFVQ
jgi:hypothetical protein